MFTAGKAREEALAAIRPSLKAGDIGALSFMEAVLRQLENARLFRAEGVRPRAEGRADLSIRWGSTPESLRAPLVKILSLYPKAPSYTFVPARKNQKPSIERAEGGGLIIRLEGAFIDQEKKERRAPVVPDWEGPACLQFREMLEALLPNRPDKNAEETSGPPEFLRFGKSSPDLRKLLREEVIQAAQRVSQGKTADLRKALMTVRQIDPEFLADTTLEGLAKAEVGAFAKFLCALQEVFLAAGEFFAVSIEGQKIEVDRGTLLSGFWQKIPYLANTFIWFAYYMDENSGTSGRAVGQYILIDPNNAKAHGIAGYFGLRHDISHMPIVTRALAEWLIKNNITVDEYVGIFSESEARQEEIQHAKDHLFAGLYFNRPVRDMNFASTAEAILKPNARAGEAYRAVSHLERHNLERIFPAQTLVEASAKLGGVIAEMDDLLKEGKTEYAYAVFLKFMAMHRGTQIRGKENGGSNSYDQSSDTILDAFRQVKDSLSSESALLQYLRRGPESPGKRALELAKEAYSANFYDDAERTALLADRSGEKNSPPRRSTFTDRAA